MPAAARRLTKHASGWTAFPLAILLLTVTQVVVPLRDGPGALLAAIAPIGHATALLLLPLAVLRRDAILAGVVMAATLAGLGAYPSEPAPPLSPAPDALRVLTWNLHGEEGGEVGLDDVLSSTQPDVMVLEETRLDHVRLPAGLHVLPFPEAATPPGMILASRLPILDSGEVTTPTEAWDKPRAFWMRLDLQPRAVTVVGVHLAVPFHPASLPCPYCPELRDSQVRALAEFVRARSAAGETVILAGDFNLSPNEVAYDDLAFLTDASRQRTWRPFGLSWLPPLLRLDYVLVTPDVDVVARDTRCSASTSDHCPLTVDLAP